MSLNDEEYEIKSHPKMKGINFMKDLTHRQISLTSSFIVSNLYFETFEKEGS